MSDDEGPAAAEDPESGGAEGAGDAGDDRSDGGAAEGGTAGPDPNGADDPDETGEAPVGEEATDGEDAGQAGGDGVEPEADASEEEPIAAGPADVEASDAATGDSGQADGTEESRIGEDLVERIAEHDPGLAEEVGLVVEKALELKERVDELEAEREDLTSRLKRKQADFQNYKKRQDREKDRIRQRATEDLVERLLDVRDNLKRALEGDHDDVESVLEGVKMTLREFDRVLDAENVTEVAPEPGDDVDPQRHEVMLRVESDREEGEIVEVYAPGYEMAGKVIRPAQVTVAQAAEGGETGEETAGGANGPEDAPGDGDTAESGAAGDADNGDAGGDAEPAPAPDGEAESADDAAGGDDAGSSEAPAADSEGGASGSEGGSAGD